MSNVLYCFIYVYICVFMHMYFVRNDEIKMFNQYVDLLRLSDAHVPQ